MPRKPIPAEHKKALREFYRSHNPRPRQKKCITWFQERYKHQLSQSSVSDHEYYNYLNSTVPSTTYRQQSSQ